MAWHRARTTDTVNSRFTHSMSVAGSRCTRTAQIGNLPLDLVHEFGMHPA